MLASLQSQGVEVEQVHVDVWKHVEDKTQTGFLTRLRLAVRWALAYPLLIWNYLRAPAHKVVMVAYPGILDILVVSLLARARGAKIVLDAFISIYDTVVIDRQLIRSSSFAAKLLYQLERFACHRAHLIILDTQAHARYFQKLFDLSDQRTAAVMVGCETAHFPRLTPRVWNKNEALHVLFYGQFIPLHGIDTIIEAARLSEEAGNSIQWTIVGTGQEAARVRTILSEQPLKSLHWLEWINYDELAETLRSSNVCLGIFGLTGKASRVIPNKVFQILSAGRPLVTMDSIAMRELISNSDEGIHLVPPGDPNALVQAITALAETGQQPSSEVAERFSESRLGESYRNLLERALT